MSLTSFLSSLQTYTGTQVFNPWRDYDAACDISPDAPAIRRSQLLAYLTPRLKRAKYLLVAEAAGYQGCRFTGIAITCERMLLDAHKDITSSMVLGRPGKRTSRPDCIYMTSRPQRLYGMNEPTDTYVWGAVIHHHIDPQDVILWNIFPFHPHKESPFTNRTPTGEEIRAGLHYATSLLSLCRPGIAIGAIGKKAESMLTENGISCMVMRHPANGGASQFRFQFGSWIQRHI